MFKRAIVRKPCRNLVNGLTTAKLGLPDYGLAMEQHQKYCLALEKCGLEVTKLEEAEDFPDSVFVEDVALLLPEVAILTRPGASSRRGEAELMKPVLNQFYPTIEQVGAPGCVEAGDIMMVGTHFYIGLSERTNREGAGQVKEILAGYNRTASVLPLKEMLHLKTGLAYLENNTMLVAGEFQGHPEMNQYRTVNVLAEEAYAANSIRINDWVLMPAGYPGVSGAVRSLGFKIIELEMSEFRKLDGGLSCLSLRF